MNIFGFTVARTKFLPSLAPLSSGSGGWFPWIREPYTGAWQANAETTSENVLTFSAVYACVRLISTDMGKMALRLVKQDENGVWSPTTSPAFSPVLRRPNRYQSINKFVESWILSKLIHGNAYILKGRDRRGVVVSMYVLDPTRVTPLVAGDGSVYYQMKRDDLSELPGETVTVPASEIIHDTMIAPFHPLIGLSPLYASGLAATQGTAIQANSRNFFANGSAPGGIVLVPGAISDATAARLKASWETNFGGDNFGRVAFLSDGMTYQPNGFINARDSQMIEQLKVSAEQVCSTFGVPPYLVDIGPPPPYANFEPLLLKYHSQCIQSLATNFEASLDNGLGLLDKIDGTQYGTEFDISDLIWMDTATRVASAKAAIEGGGMSPNEARFRYHALGPVTGGESPMVQQQNFSLAALAERDADHPFAKPQPAPVAAPAQPADDTPAKEDLSMDEAASFFAGFEKSQEQLACAT